MAESVYISSTFTDLKPFRQAIINCIVSLGDFYKPVSMEFYDAEDLHFVEKCLNDVAACDIYILILGKRYGYIPKGYEKSITEMEYEKARDTALAEKGKGKEVLVFKVGDLCNTYNYQENETVFKEYQQTFVDEINVRLSPKPFESEAELSLQVTQALMKRLFKRMRTGEKIIPPDKDSVLCYCDRTPQISLMKRNVVIDKKKMFFLWGNRLTDFPNGVVKRFAKYTLGSINKIEPLIKITDLITGSDPSGNDANAIWNILEYLNLSPEAEDTVPKGFIERLAKQKSKKVILPFYYDFDFDEDAVKMNEFLRFCDAVFREYQAGVKSYELYFMFVIYSAAPDKDTLQRSLQNYPDLNRISSFVEKLKPVQDVDITDWIEKFITTSEFSPEIYKQYFHDNSRREYTMQEVNVALSKIIDDLGAGNKNITQYI